MFRLIWLSINYTYFHIKYQGRCCEKKCNICNRQLVQLFKSYSNILNIIPCIYVVLFIDFYEPDPQMKIDCSKISKI